MGDSPEGAFRPRASGRGAARHGNAERRLRRRHQQYRCRRRQRPVHPQRRNHRNAAARRADRDNGGVARSSGKRNCKAGGGATPASQKTPAPRAKAGAAVSRACVDVRVRECTRGRALKPRARPVPPPPTAGHRKPRAQCRPRARVPDGRATEQAAAQCAEPPCAPAANGPVAPTRRNATVLRRRPRVASHAAFAGEPRSQSSSRALAPFSPPPRRRQRRGHRRAHAFACVHIAARPCCDRPARITGLGRAPAGPCAIWRERQHAPDYPANPSRRR